jgi:peptidoglycan/xylan/chitin deacetylase (PgdA/CDA1 family)
MKIALKIDVDTLRGTREGVPMLAEICRRHSAQATFLFSVGPDHTGRALRRMLRPGFLSKVRRTSVLSHYGLITCLYGTLLPGPDIGLRCRALLRDIRDRGFETGIHAFDHVLWQDNVASADRLWTVAQMRQGYERFFDIFGATPVVHGAAGWQMNDAAFIAEDLFGFEYASDTRGGSPFFPRIAGTAVDCLQLPTTLPTLDELIGRAELADLHPVDHLLGLTEHVRGNHVYTLHAELEGQRLAAWFERLLRGWRQQGYELTSLGALAASIDRSRVPVKDVQYGAIPGRVGALALEH